MPFNDRENSTRKTPMHDPRITPSGPSFLQYVGPPFLKCKGKSPVVTASDAPAVDRTSRMRLILESLKLAMTYDSKSSSSTTTEVRNMISFWIFGMCNNFTFSAMLSAAQDILNRKERSPFVQNVTDVCVPEITSRICSPTSAGVVLLCNVVPALMIKLMCPFVMHRIPYGIRHFFICTLQATSLLLTAFAESVPAALVGVCVASVAGGFGETTYLGLAGHYSKHTIATWSSGTGMAGLAGAFSYAGMTDARLLALTSTQAMLVMLVVPAMFAFTYYIVLVRAPTVREISVIRPSEWFSSSQSLEIKASPSTTDIDKQLSAQAGLVEQLKIAKSLLKYMVPMFLVYVAEYLINQGLLELTIFDCSHGYGTSPASQYRWYQVMYQTGVFISRSSLKLIQFNMTLIALMPLLQLLNTIFLTFNAIYAFVPSFGMVCVMILYEGLIGGGSYVNTFHHIHRKVDPSIREFALSTVSLADTLGILVAALSAIPLHNAICSMQWYG
uniref:Battenin n=1 Tax=Haemonchus contortus TaxID=6289 RepID=A0A7I5E764_HAECO